MFICRKGEGFVFGFDVEIFILGLVILFLVKFVCEVVFLGGFFYGRYRGLWSGGVGGNLKKE